MESLKILAQIRQENILLSSQILLEKRRISQSLRLYTQPFRFTKSYDFCLSLSKSLEALLRNFISVESTLERVPFNSTEAVSNIISLCLCTNVWTHKLFSQLKKRNLADRGVVHKLHGQTLSSQLVRPNYLHVYLAIGTRIAVNTQLFIKTRRLGAFINCMDRRVHVVCEWPSISAG